MTAIPITTQSGNRKYRADEWDAFNAGHVGECPYVPHACVCDPIWRVACALIREQTYARNLCHNLSTHVHACCIKCAIVFSDAIIRYTDMTSAQTRRRVLRYVRLLWRHIVLNHLRGHRRRHRHRTDGDVGGNVDDDYRLTLYGARSACLHFARHEHACRQFRSLQLIRDVVSIISVKICTNGRNNTTNEHERWANRQRHRQSQRNVL